MDGIFWDDFFRKLQRGEMHVRIPYYIRHGNTMTHVPMGKVSRLFDIERCASMRGDKIKIMSSTFYRYWYLTSLPLDKIEEIIKTLDDEAIDYDLGSG